MTKDQKRYQQIKNKSERMLNYTLSSFGRHESRYLLLNLFSLVLTTFTGFVS